MLSVLPLKVSKKSSRFCLYDDLDDALERSDVQPEAGDIIAVSSKYVANSQGRMLDLQSVRLHGAGATISHEYSIPRRFAEVIARESDYIMGGMRGFAMCVTDGILAPNAGIDRSNSAEGRVILYPYNTYRVAEQMRRRIFLKHAAHVGVIITDSRLMPVRAGTVGVAISCAGMEPVTDMRGRADLDGRPLRVTMQAAADALATFANHAMGEGAESCPYVVIRGSGVAMTTRNILPGETAVSHEQCIYMRSMRK